LKDIDFTEPINKEKVKSSEPFQLRTGKRLFRDPEIKWWVVFVLVSAAYFGIHDVVWVRIAFVVMTLLFGSS
jgi:hypothetical protein